MIIETSPDGYSIVTLDDGRKFDVMGLALPDYGVDNEGNSYIFTKTDREMIAQVMIDKCKEYAAKEVKNG